MELMILLLETLKTSYVGNFFFQDKKNFNQTLEYFSTSTDS